MKYGISSAGVSALRKLSTDMNSINSDIRDCCTTLSSVVSGLGDSLGEFEEPILDLIDKVDNTQSKAEDSVSGLATKVSSLADKAESILSAGI